MSTDFAEELTHLGVGWLTDFEQYERAVEQAFRNSLCSWRATVSSSGIDRSLTNAAIGSDVLAWMSGKHGMRH